MNYQGPGSLHGKRGPAYTTLSSIILTATPQTSASPAAPCRHRHRRVRPHLVGGGGLRQRISITRALLGDPPIIFLDEPSSNLDREGEQELVATLKTLAVDHTAIVISHSPALLSACDQVLVMQRGRVVRSGRPEDVLPPQLLVGSGMAQLAIPPSLIPARDQTRGCSGGFRGPFYTDWSRRAKKSKQWRPQANSIT